MAIVAAPACLRADWRVFRRRGAVKLIPGPMKLFSWPVTFAENEARAALPSTTGFDHDKISPQGRFDFCVCRFLFNAFDVELCL